MTMKRYPVDTVLRVRLRHRPGQLARLAAAIAAEGAVIGEIATLRQGENETVREITVETEDEAHAERVVAAVRGVEGIELEQVTDRVFERHRGGKLHSPSRVKIERVAE